MLIVAPASCASWTVSTNDARSAALGCGCPLPPSCRCRRSGRAAARAPSPSPPGRAASPAGGLVIGRVDVLVELGAVAAERLGRARSRGRARARSPRSCASAALFVASVSNGAASSTRTVSSAVIAVSSFTPSKVTACVPPAATVTVFGSASGRRAEHQRQRRRRAGVGVQLGDVRDDVDRPRRERLLRRVHGRDDKVRAELRDPVATQDPCPRRLLLADVHLHVDRRAALERRRGRPSHCRCGASTAFRLRTRFGFSSELGRARTDWI